ncbi:MAG: MgtC/SapB family protein [Candidatus Dojkabacteria bacterium]
MEAQLTTSDILMRLILAIFLGAIMGLERDPNLKNQTPTKEQAKAKSAHKFTFIKSNIPASGLGGLRTYILIALLGSLSGIAYYFKVEALMWIVSGGLVLFILTSFVLNYFDKNTFGLTTEISIIIVYTLSLLLFASKIEPKLIVAVSIFNSFVLSIKNQTRYLVSKFSSHEVVESLKFILFTLVILPFLPNNSFSLGDLPLLGTFFTKLLGNDLVNFTDVINPYRLWQVVVFVSGLNFIGYFLSKLFGKDKGLNLVGLLGGLISSTTVTEAMAAASKEVTSKVAKNRLIYATILANLTSFFRIVIIALVINVELGMRVALPMITMGIFLFIWFVVSNSINKRRQSKDDKTTDIVKNSKFGFSFETPFSFKPALIFMLLYLFVILFTQIAYYFLGDSGFIVSSMISSLSGLDAITINTSVLAGTEVTFELGIIVLVVAACVNLVVKVVFSMLFGDKYFIKKIAWLFLITILLGISMMLFVLRMI